MPEDNCNDSNSAAAVVANAPTELSNIATAYNTAVSNSRTSDLTTGQLSNLVANLTGQKASLRAQIKDLQGSIERYNRDFIDLNDTMTPNTGKIHTLDDYTLWVLLVSYLLFAISVVFWYSHTSFYTPTSIAISVGGMALISMLLVILAIIVL